MNRYDEIYAPDYIRVSPEEIEEYKNQIEDLETELDSVTTDLKWFLKNFIEKGNEEGKTFEQAYTEMFEIYKGYDYEKYIKEK